MSVNPNWGINEIISNIKALKHKYIGVLASFSYFELKDRANYIRTMRNEFYKLKIDQWQINLLWDYMNDYIGYEEIQKILN